jgi:hypothetical protein
MVIRVTSTYVEICVRKILSLQAEMYGDILKMESIPWCCDINIEIYIYIYYRKKQDTILISSISATCFSPSEFHQAIKYIV